MNISDKTMAKLRATNIVERLTAATYVPTDDKERHIREAHLEFNKLAAHMGYHVEQIEPDPELQAEIAQAIRRDITA